MKQNFKHRGMTAIEILAATVLASLMLASVAGLMGALARQERVLRIDSGESYWHPQLAEQLLWDLKNTRRCLVSRHGVRLEGFAGRDFATGRPTLCPAVIEYYLIDTATGNWLMRHELHPDELANNATRVDVVCCGVDRLAWGNVVVDQVAPAAMGMTIPGEPAAIPERLAIQLYESKSPDPFFDRVFHIH